MPSANTSENAGPRPRVGIPWRTSAEERQQNREKLDYYFRAVRKAGAEPEEVSLEQPKEELERRLRELDAFVLPGSPADVDPGRYGAAKHLKTKTLDENRDETDEAILRQALATAKPVLAICYGCQLLNTTLFRSTSRRRSPGRCATATPTCPREPRRATQCIQPALRRTAGWPV
jgi:gamma-glutamyl-gamma-aminobutyrate hydrolase PuuD